MISHPEADRKSGVSIHRNSRPHLLTNRACLEEMNAELVRHESTSATTHHQREIQDRHVM